MNRILAKAVPHLVFAALAASVLGACVTMGASLALIHTLCWILVTFYIAVCVLFIPFYERSLGQKIKDIQNNFTFSRYDGSRTVSRQLDRLRKNIRGYMEKKQAEETMLRDRDTFRREFIGNLAHELKTPLFTAQGYILTLMEGGMDDPAISAKYLKRASIGLDRLVSVVKDLDTITKLESGRNVPVREDFDLAALAENIVGMVDMEAAERGVKVYLEGNYDEPMTVYADEMRIEQVLTNLVINSVRYSKEKGGYVRIRFYRADDKIVTEVSDNGIGIAPGDLTRIFERFYRVDKSRSRDNGGSGLGLSIVKHIIESHGEKIEAESRLGRGSKFRFTLPASGHWISEERKGTA